MTVKLLRSVVLAALIVASGTVIYLSRGLPDQSGKTLHYLATDFNFAFGSGRPVGDRMLVDEFANGYALLSSGPVNIQADALRALSYTWLPPKIPQEAAFFWRRLNDTQNVMRSEISTPGTQLIYLSAEPDWRGEITEFGFLVAGVNGKTVEIGSASFIPDSLSTRLQLSWRAWTDFEEWSQQSVNFLHGGDYRQLVSLPLLVTTWLLISLLLLWLFSRHAKNIGSRQLLITAGLVFLSAWVVLDIRWTANNLRQIQLSLQSHTLAGGQQGSSIGLDGKIVQYVQRLKSGVLGDQNARILILGDDNAVDYYLLRAKYHLLPHSVDVAARFSKDLLAESLDFVIFFGEPARITEVPGWSLSWKKKLIQIDRDEWGVVYRVR